jgi:hypothetical protein
MSTDTKPVDAEVVWSRADWPEDSYITDAVIEESGRARRELVAAVAGCRSARAGSCAHSVAESEMTDECEYGCKIFRCLCGHSEVRHMASYGCPIGRAELAGAR